MPTNRFYEFVSTHALFDGPRTLVTNDDDVPVVILDDDGNDLSIIDYCTTYFLAKPDQRGTQFPERWRCVFEFEKFVILLCERTIVHKVDDFVGFYWGIFPSLDQLPSHHWWEYSEGSRDDDTYHHLVAKAIFSSDVGLEGLHLVNERENSCGMPVINLRSLQGYDHDLVIKLVYDSFKLLMESDPNFSCFQMPESA